MALTAAEEAQTRELIAQQAAILSLADSEAAIISNLGATDVSLSDLTAATAIDDSDLLLIRQGVTDKSVAGSIVKAAGSQPDASTTVKGIVELATDAETQTGTDSTRAVTPAGRRADTATTASDGTYADNSTKSASTQWVRGAMSAIATAAGFAISLAANGYIKLPSWLGGLILEWGSVSVANEGTATVTFPITFPTACYQVVATPRLTTFIGGGNLSVYAGNLSTTTFTIVNDSGGAGAGNTTCMWMAVGN